MAKNSNPPMHNGVLVCNTSGVYNPNIYEKKEMSPEDLLIKQSVRAICFAPAVDYSIAETKRILKSFKLPNGHDFDPHFFKNEHINSLCHDFLNKCAKEKKPATLIAMKVPVSGKVLSIYKDSFVPLDALSLLDHSRKIIKPFSFKRKMVLASEGAILKKQDGHGPYEMNLFISRTSLGRSLSIEMYHKTAVELPHLFKKKEMFVLGYVNNIYLKF